MSDELKLLAERIRNELVELERVVHRVETGWELLAFANFLEEVGH